MNKKTGKDIMYDYDEKINFSVFPGLQGGPHNHTISGLAVALKQAQSEEFVKYQQQVMKNMVAMVDRLKEHGVKIVSEGTDNHLVLCDLRPFGVDGSRVERVLELAHIACNKNTVPETSPRWFRRGLCLDHRALAARGFTEEDFVKVADYIKKGIDITVEISKEVEGKKFGDFKKVLDSKEFPAIGALKKEVESFGEEFRPLASTRPRASTRSKRRKYRARTWKNVKREFILPLSKYSPTYQYLFD